MAKSIAKKPRREQVDTEDRIMESVASVTVWAQQNRRMATLVLLAVAAAVVAGGIYVRYRADLNERAAVRLDALKLSAQGAAPEVLRADLGVFIAQYEGTDEAAEARVFLAEMELRRDSLDAAIAVLEPIARPGSGTPIAYHATTMLASTHERMGNADAAMRVYRDLESSALYDYQRRAARSAQARLHEYAGEYDEAERILAELADDEAGAADGAFYGVRLGEVRARAQAQLEAPSVPVIVPPVVEEPPTE